jgi:FkbH-like protein
MTRFFPGRAGDGSILAGALRERRQDLARALFRAIRDRSCASWEQPLEFDGLEEWGRAHLYTALDLLAKALETGDPLYQELFEGWVRSRMVADLSRERVPADYDPHRVLQLAAAQWLELLGPQASRDVLAILERELNGVIALLATRPHKQVRILFIGDCIQYEIITALVGPCARDGINVAATVMNQRVQPQFRNRIRELAPGQFDVVFFSPFSYVFSPEYASLLQPRSALLTTAQITARLAPALREVALTLETMASHLDSRIYVHNTTAVVQSFGTVVGFARHLASWKNRTRARRLINDAIGQYVGDLRSSADGRVLLVDENALRQEYSDWALGQVYFNSYALHPTRLGVEVGRRLYREAVYANAFLVTKKVVVCDLDNTLWDGLAGEGEVRHHRDRQEVLLALKARGVLLAINSKNDVKNIRWTGARLSADDFVSSQINWDQKALNMARIRDELNLRLKDFVFLDDRPDERERVQAAFPEVLVLDATQPATWKMLAHWARLLPGEGGANRTRLYQERLRREQHLKERRGPESGPEDETAPLKALELRVKIREARGADLKRAVELVNRTNQFNLCGSRTSVRDLEEGISSRHSVIVAEAADKYGNMGMVGVMIARWRSEAVEIPIFVLSCRAFGFGIEHALLNSLRTLAPETHQLVGHYKPTQSNEPCRKLYPDSGLSWDGGSWVGKIADLPADPVWLAVQNQCGPGHAGRAFWAAGTNRATIEVVE